MKYGQVKRPEHFISITSQPTASLFLSLSRFQICLIVYDLYRSRPEVILPQSWQASEDVEIQGEEDTRRWGKEEEEGDMHEEAIVKEKHANHRYGEPLEERAGSKPQPFHLPKGISL